MIPSFSLLKTPKIYFAAKSLHKLPELISQFGRTVLIITGAKSFQNSKKWNILSKKLKEEAITYYTFAVSGEPSPKLIDEAVKTHKSKNIEVVISIGGGSALDAGKAISAMLPLKNSIIDYLEGVGKELNHPGIKIPFIAVPTTAGTGSEATSNAVISHIGEKGFKRSLRHDNFVPDIALIDPELMLSSPVHLTAACGMDAFTQLLESYLSTKANPLTDTLALSGIKYLNLSLISLCTTDKESIEDRANLAYAALISGITLANAGLGIIHGFASSIGGFFNIPHGVICGALLKPSIQATINHLETHDPQNIALKKCAQIGSLINGTPPQNIKEGTVLLISKLEEWTRSLKIPFLSEYGIKKTDLDKIAKETRKKNNPGNLNQEEIKEILKEKL